MQEPITNQKAADVEIARAIPIKIGFVPEASAIPIMTGPMTATVAPALIKLVKLAPTNTTRTTNGIPESIPNGSTKPIIDEANQPAAPVDLKTEPRK